MVMIFGNFFELAYVEMLRKKLEVEHRIVFAVLAKESNVFAEIHILEMVCNETAVAALNAPPEIRQYSFILHSQTISGF